MQGFTKTILSALQTWVNKRIKDNTPDWNENDSGADGYIKNRPFYTEEINSVFANNTTIKITNEGEPVIDPFSMDAIVKGQVYSVVWDETKYECVAYIAEGPNTLSIGNGAIAGASGGNGEPFFITIFDNILMVFGSKGEHTITISGVTENVKKIDTKYLPEVEPIPEGALRPDYNIFTPSEVGYIKNRPCYYDGARLDTDTPVQISGVGYGGSIDTEERFNHNFVIGQTYRIVGDIGVNYVPFGTVNWHLDFTAPAVASGVYFDLGGLSFNQEFTIPANTKIKVKLDGIANLSEEYESWSGRLQGYYYGNNWGDQTSISFTYIHLHAYLVKELDEIMIPDTIARTEDIPTVAQPDWNQNDPNAADYVKNRTHFYGRGLVPIIQANGGGKDYGVGLMEYRGVLPVGEFELFEEGVTYTISCNGVSDTIVGTSSTILSAAASELPNISANTNITLFAVNAYGSTRDYHIRVEGGNSDDVWTVAKESDVIVPLDEKFIPDTIARTEDIPTVVQPDWNQNDPTADDYIKNKTHYENIVYNTYSKLLTLKNVPATAANTDRRVGSSFSERDIGSVFIVIFDGTKYVCVLEQVPVEPVTGTDSLAGQEQIRFALGDKTFEKFPFYYYQRNYSAYRICVPDDGLSHNIELWSSQEIKTLVQLDEKYIPDTIARVEQVPIIDETLTIAQKAADSKVVGDKINDINSSLSMQIVSSKNYISLIDQISGLPYMISIQDGNLVSEIGVESIEVTTPPIVSEYVHGENIDTTGMVVTAIRFDGTTKDVTNEVKVGYAMEGQGAKITYTQAGIDIIAYAPVSVASFDADRILVDFEYINNNDGTYTITGWKGTYNGEPSTEIIIPDYGCIIL